MFKKLMLGAVLPVGIMIAFVLLRVSVSVKEIIGLSLAQLLGFLIFYPWVWKPRGITFRRSMLMATVTIGISAAVLAISSWIATSR